jgi:hydrogenase 3 maturation protease
VAVVGIGQELNGDDGAGVLVVRRLSALARRGSGKAAPNKSQGPGAFPGPCDLLIIEAAHAPENCLGPLLRFRPALVIVVDAAELGERPGTVRWLDWQETAGLSASTHTLPPSMLARFLVPAAGCEVAVLAIQAADTALGAPLSPEVAAAVEEILNGLSQLLAISPARPGGPLLKRPSPSTRESC